MRLLSGPHDSGVLNGCPHVWSKPKQEWVKSKLRISTFLEWPIAHCRTRPAPGTTTHTNVRIASRGVQQSFRGVQRRSRLRVRARYRQGSRLGCFWTTFNDVVTERSHYDGPARATEAGKGILEQQGSMGSDRLGTPK